jgi:predicted transcriptional regulator
MSFSSNGEWRLTGGSLESARQAAQFGQQSDNLDQRSQSVLSIVQQHPEGVKAIEIANKLGLQRGAVDIILSRLLRSGRISKSQRGVYTPQTEQLPLNMTQVQEV